MKKSIKAILLALGLSLALVACNGATTESTATTDAEATETNEMQYITPDDAKAAIEGEEEANYILLDVRKAEDYEAGHPDGFANADLDNAKNGDAEDGVAKLEAAIDEETGGEGVGDKDVLLMCYSGASYAQAGTDLLINELGVDPSQVYTIEGGMKEW